MALTTFASPPFVIVLGPSTLKSPLTSRPFGNLISFCNPIYAVSNVVIGAPFATVAAIRSVATIEHNLHSFLISSFNLFEICICIYIYIFFLPY